MCEWTFASVHTLPHTDTNVTWQSIRQVSKCQDFGNTLTIHPEVGKVFFSFKKSSLTDFSSFTFSTPRQCSHVRAVLEESLKQSQHSCSEAALYASVIMATDWWRQNISHLKLVQLSLVRSEKCKASLHSQISHSDSQRLCVDVKASARPLHSPPSPSGSERFLW